jgi:hypothetical protein
MNARLEEWRPISPGSPRQGLWKLFRLSVVSALLFFGLQTAGASAAGSNIALNRPVTASSLEADEYAADNVVDGNLSTRWSSNDSDPQWIYVDLGATYNIAEVVLNWETAYGKAYRIQVSPDATNWTTIYSTTTGTGATDELKGLSGTGRYVRMYGTTRGTSWGYSQWEFAVYGTPASPAAGSVYWGALMDGNDTYDYYYGPSGFWKDAPWGNAGSTWDKFESNAGKKVSILHYGQPNPWLQSSFQGSTANIVTGRGAIPEIDMSSNSTPIADIANGVYDSSIKTWANNVKAWGKPFLLRWDWEMNGTWFAWGAQAQASPAAFVAMWRHFHDVVVGQGATNVTWVWCPNLEFSGSTPLAQLYPGDAYVDWTCIDGYNSGSTSQSFTKLYQQTYNNLLTLAPTKPIMIGEVASLEYGSGVKAAWITGMLTALPSTFPRIKAVDWFNWRILKNGAYKSWPIESSASSQSAFAAGIASSYYASNKFGNLPPLTKVKALP